MMRLQPMGIGDILDTAFRLYRRKFATFIGISAVVCLPTSFAAALLVAAARLFAPREQPDNDLLQVVSNAVAHAGWTRAAVAVTHLAQVPNMQNVLMPLLGMITSVALLVIAFVVVFSLAYPLCTGALVVNISATYLGEDIGATQSYVRAFRKLWRLLMAQAWATTFVLLGLVLCIVPGIVLSLQLLLVPQVVLLEDQKPWPALGRSRHLMMDYLSKAFLLCLVVWLLGAVFGATITTVLHFVPWPYPVLGDFFGYFFVEVVMLPLSIAANVLLYYDLRIRKEAFDLQHLAGSMVEFRPT